MFHSWLPSTDPRNHTQGEWSLRADQHLGTTLVSGKHYPWAWTIKSNFTHPQRPTGYKGWDCPPPSIGGCTSPGPVPQPRLWSISKTTGSEKGLMPIGCRDIIGLVSSWPYYPARGYSERRIQRDRSRLWWEALVPCRTCSWNGTLVVKQSCPVGH